MIELQKTKNIPANWDEKHLSIDGVDNLLDDKYSYEEKKGSMHYTGCIGEDTEVSIFAHVRSNIMNIICSRKETILRVQEWCRATEENIEDLSMDVTVFDLIGNKYSIIIKSYMEVEI